MLGQSEIDPSTSENFNFDEFEKELAEDCPEVVNMMCFLDEMAENESTLTPDVSKKQQKRDRIERLKEMIKDGRNLLETNQESTSKWSWTNVLEKMKQFNNGPLGLLAKAVQKQLKIEIRTRNVNRIDRIFTGIPMTFDFHMNVVLRSVRETVLLGRQDKQQIGQRNRLQDNLPKFLKWNDGGVWPLPIGNHRVVLFRDQRACFIKGDTVVLIRIL